MHWQDFVTLGWAANIFIFIAYWKLGQKSRNGWAYSVAGNILWCVYALQLGMVDMLAVDIVALTMAAWNWWLWRDK